MSKKRCTAVSPFERFDKVFDSESAGITMLDRQTECFCKPALHVTCINCEPHSLPILRNANFLPLCGGSGCYHGILGHLAPDERVVHLCGCSVWAPGFACSKKPNCRQYYWTQKEFIELRTLFYGFDEDITGPQLTAVNVCLAQRSWPIVDYRVTLRRLRRHLLSRVHEFGILELIISFFCRPKFVPPIVSEDV